MDKTQLWGEAVVEHPSGINASLFATIQSDIYSSVYCLLFIVFLLLFFKYIRHSIALIVRCCFRFSLAIKSDENLSLEQGRLILFIFSLFHFAMVSFFFVKTCRADIYHTYGWLIAPFFFFVFLLIYLLRWAVLSFIGWVVQSPNELTFLTKNLRDFVILAAMATLPLSLSSLFSWSSAINPLITWCVSALILCYLLFLFRTLQYFIYVRFSIFFWILYLCSLEVAPLALLYSVFLTL